MNFTALKKIGNVLVLIQLKYREFTAVKRDVNFLTRGNICPWTPTYDKGIFVKNGI